MSFFVLISVCLYFAAWRLLFAIANWIHPLIFRFYVSCRVGRYILYSKGYGVKINRNGCNWITIILYIYPDPDPGIYIRPRIASAIYRYIDIRKTEFEFEIYSWFDIFWRLFEYLPISGNSNIYSKVDIIIVQKLYYYIPKWILLYSKVNIKIFFYSAMRVTHCQCDTCSARS